MSTISQYYHLVKRTQKKKPEMGKCLKSKGKLVDLSLLRQCCDRYPGKWVVFTLFFIVNSCDFQSQISNTWSLRFVYFYAFMLSLYKEGQFFPILKFLILGYLVSCLLCQRFSHSVGSLYNIEFRVDIL